MFQYPCYLYFTLFRLKSHAPLGGRWRSIFFIEHSASDTVFHKILRKEIPVDVLVDDDDVLAFRDIHPKAPTHILFVPKRFVASIADVSDETADIPGMLILKARVFAKQKGIDGYKLTFHVGKGGGQEVMYLHLHLLSEQKV